MKKFFTIAFSIMTVVALIGLQGCQKEDLIDSSGLETVSDVELKKADMNIFYSSALPVGNGTARAWVHVDKMGHPMSVGIELSEKALTNLPTGAMQYELTFPKTKNSFYSHALFDWNPEGHEPEHVYDVPHFDFHFYTISGAERKAIPFMDETYMDPAPADLYIPGNYIQLPGLIPEMGAHWVDVTSPELNGSPFTHTMIWGSYNAHFIFWEPMITLDYLLSKPDDLIAIPQPSAYEMSGWYATHYVIKYSEKPGRYTVALVNLTYHEGE